MIPLSLNEVISAVHQNDARREENKLHREREARKALRIQAETAGKLNISELLTALTGGIEPTKDETIEVKTTETPHARDGQAAFPPPPTGPASKGSG